MAEVAVMAEAGQIWQERPPKLDRPSLSFGSGQLWQKWQKWQENSIKRLSPKNNVTPYPDTGSGTIHSGLPDAYQNPLATKTANPQAFPTTSENVFLKRSVGDSAISRPASAISLRSSVPFRQESVTFHSTPSKLDRRPISFGPVPKVPFQTKTFPTAPECLSPSSVPARPALLTPCGLTRTIADIIAPA